MMEKLNEAAELSINDIASIISEVDEYTYELDDDEHLDEAIYKTAFNEYKLQGVSLDSKYVIPLEQYYSILRDIVEMFIDSMPYCVQVCIDSDALFETIQKDFPQVQDLIKAINKNDGNLDDLYSCHLIDFDEVSYAVLGL